LDKHQANYCVVVQGTLLQRCVPSRLEILSGKNTHLNIKY